MHSTLQMWATQVHPHARAVTVSFFAGAVFFGGALASAAAAPLVDKDHFSAVFLAGAIGAFTLAVIGPLLRARYLGARGSSMDPGEPEPVPVAP